jgi:hypothetical protein
MKKTLIIPEILMTAQPEMKSTATIYPTIIAWNPLLVIPKIQVN